MKRILLSALALIIGFSLSSKPFAANKHPEKYYQKNWCDQHSGKTEVQLADRTRVDCLTDSHAVEFDWGKKWAEAIGQSLYYSLQTGKRAGVVLIIDGVKERRYWIRLNTTIDHFGLPIDAWMVEK